MEEDNNSLVYIPEEVVSDILIRLPSKVLFDVMRYVCRLWYNIISSPDFVKLHLDRSTNDLVLLYVDKSHSSFESVTISKDFSLTRLDFTSHYIVSDSCDGLVLLENSKLRNRGKTPFYIANPVTRQYIPYSSCPSNFSDVVGLKLGRSISGVCKLLCYHYSPYASISVLTLGKGKDDDWRSIGLGDENLTKTHVFGPSITTGGCFYVHAIIRRKDDHSPGIVILAVDLETEIVRQIQGPLSYSCNVDHVNVSIIGGCFSVLYYEEDKRELCVWRLRSGSTAEWDMVSKYQIGLLDYGPYLKPLGWVVDGEVLAMSCLTSGDVFTYNFKTRNTAIIVERELPTRSYRGIYVFYHAETLVRL